MSDLATLRRAIDARVERVTESGCWIWMGCIGRDNYGHVRAEGRTQRAHRVAYRAFREEGIGAGLSVCHRCDQTLCCNPDHLFLGTHSENIQDMHRKGRHKVKRLISAAYPWAHLTMEQAAAIRKDLSAGVPRREIRAKYGTTKNVLQKIASGKTYVPIPEPQ